MPNKKSGRFYLPLLVMLLFCATSPVLAQNTDATKGYVKMEIGAMGLHCPFLGVTLIDQLIADTSYNEVTVDKSDQFLTFSYAKNDTYTVAFFEAIAVNVGYPLTIVTITLADEQPVIEARD